MRRMHTLLLPDGGRLFAADCLADVVEDGEELQPVFDRGGTSTPACVCGLLRMPPVCLSAPRV